MWCIQFFCTHLLTDILSKAVYIFQTRIPDGGFENALTWTLTALGLIRHVSVTLGTASPLNFTKPPSMHVYSKPCYLQKCETIVLRQQSILSIVDGYPDSTN